MSWPGTPGVKVTVICRVAIWQATTNQYKKVDRRMVLSETRVAVGDMTITRRSTTPLNSQLMGCPATSDVKGNALRFSAYLVRKSIAIASSFAFLTDTWLTTMVERQAAVKSTMTPNAIMASTKVIAATPLLLRIPEHRCRSPLRSRRFEAGGCAVKETENMAARPQRSRPKTGRSCPELSRMNSLDKTVNRFGGAATNLEK